MTSISDGEGGLSVRTKLNDSLAVTDAFSVSSGNVGIGTTAPLSKLHVNTGAAGYGITVAANAQTSNEFQLGIDSSSNFAIYDTTAAANRMVISNAGNVGIGTSSPTTRVHALSTTGDILYLDGSGTATGAADTGAGIRFLGHNGTVPIDLGRIGAYKTNSTVGNTAGYMAFFAKPNASGLTEAMRIDASGNVGIGTSAPNAASIVDAQSTTKGVRFPNMTTTQKNAIANVAGNVVFDTTLGKLCVNTGSGWQTITSA